MSRIIDLDAVRRARAALAELVAEHPELTEPEARARLATYLESNMAELTEALYLRCAPEDIERLNALAERLPLASRNAIARAAMRIGLAAIEADPAKALVAAPAPKKRTAKR